jgi:exodeoxyribonuclease V gamma subunit
MKVGMKHLHLFTGNRLESLVAALAEVLRRPQQDPMAPEIVVVQSLGMERWIAMALARRHGISANMTFPFPNDFIYTNVFRAVLPDLPENAPFDRPVMAWRLMEILPACLGDPEFAALKHYLDGGDGDLKRFQLSQRIADLFDQYLTFRPDWILDWEAGGGAGWQPSLWRRLSEGRRRGHRAALARSLVSLLRDAPLLSEALPERVSVFGISSLPRFHMEILDAISHHREVNLFLMNPCADFWGDTLSRGEHRRLIRSARDKAVPEAALHLDGQNSLLASLGILGRDFFDMLNDFDPESDDMFAPPGRDSLLTSIQSDILERIERPSAAAPPAAVPPGDPSISVHACHSPMRETEVLYDHLLAMFDADETLRPGDVLVMAPDIEAYAPYIQAVFDRPPDDPKRIPFSIADRGARTESRLVEAFMNLLDLGDGRLGAAQVAAFLETPWIRRKFDLDEADVERIRHWIREARIRWGIDGSSRARLGLPETEEHTWQAGLDRLLMGYAMAGRETRTFDGILPFDAMEGSETAALGGLLEFTQRLFTHAADLEEDRTPAAWAAFLNSVVDAFFEVDTAAEREIQMIDDAVADLASTAGRAEFDRAVSRRVVRSYLAERLERDAFGFGFITGGVTFCAMLPMRSIPFRVIALLGMNSTEYPRSTPAPGFDLMAARPRPGDRSRRKDDRYLFLETLLSAREKLYISYVGQSIHDNSPIPPSVLVSELLDTIERGFTLAGGGSAADGLVTLHRLQAFSPAYFRKSSGNDGLFSYSGIHLAAARQLAAGRSAPVPFISRGLPEPEPPQESVDLAELCRFFANPHQYLLNHRLGIYLDEDDAFIPEKEPFDIAGLDRYRLGGDLLANRMAGQPPSALFPLKRSAGELPHGQVGNVLYENLSDEAEAFFERIAPLVEAPDEQPVEVHLPVEAFTLTGRIADIRGGRRIHYRFATVKARDLLAAWIYHLGLNAADGSHPRESVVAGTDRIWALPPVPEAPRHLARLLAVYQEGLRRPLPFFPRSSLAFAEQHKGRKRSAAEALRAAQRCWRNYLGTGEGDNPYFQRCVGDDDPFDDAFQETAIAVFGPLIDHRELMG